MIYTWWLGAAWFMTVLLGITVLHRVLFQLLGRRYGIPYAAISIILYLLGCSLAKHGFTKWNIDLILIAQIYFSAGLNLKRYAGKIVEESSPCAMIAVAIVAFLIMRVNATQFHYTVDYPARRFNSPIVDFVLALNGTVFVYALSRLLENIPYFNRGIGFLGKNTLPILLFHFISFKLVYVLLAAVGCMQLNQMMALTPPTEIGSRFWWLIAPVAIACCLVAWKGINSISVLRFIFGQEKQTYKAGYERLLKIKIWKKLDRAIDSIEIPRLKVFTKERMALVKKYRPYILLVCFMLVLVLVPVMKQGIMLNDEVQGHQYRQQSWYSLLISNIKNEMRMGRPLRILAALNMSLSFISENIYFNRVIQCVFIIAGFASFSYFICKLINNRRFVAFLAVFMALFYPITFEHATPNAFNGLVFIPMTELFLSLSLFCDYLDAYKKRNLYCAALLLLVALLGYEYMITFVPLYGLTYMYKSFIQNRFDMRKCIQAVGVCGLIGGIYVAALIALSKLSHGEYDGAQFGFVSFSSSFSILRMLFLSALPGYWLTNPKYTYLLNLYQVGNEITVRNVLLIAFGFLVMFYLIKGRKSTVTSWTRRHFMIQLAILSVGFVYCFLPASANAVSKLYQGNVTSENFTALTVTSYLYLFTCFTICYAIWMILQRVKSKGMSALICAALIALFAFPVQYMNDVFAQEQYSNNERFVTMNELFETETFKKISYNKIYAPELYETYNTLAIHRGYFEFVAELNGVQKISIVTEMDDSCSVMLFETGLNQWTITTGDEAVILSKHRLAGEVGVRLLTNQYEIADITNQRKDGNFYCYHFIKDHMGNLIESDEEALTSIYKAAGSALKTANLIYGVYSDGWVEKEASVQIGVGEEGIIRLTGYYNQEITGNETISVYQGESLLAEYTLTAQDFEFEIPCTPNSIVELTMISSFSIEAAPPDIRELSFILKDLRGE